MKAFLLLAVVVVARAQVVPDAPVADEEGNSTHYRREDNLGNYNFGYVEDHTSGGSFRRESRDAYGNVAGSYGLRDADGRIRIVNYVANDEGFQADIQTNEHGVTSTVTADANFSKDTETVDKKAADPSPVMEPVAIKPVAIKNKQVAFAFDVSHPKPYVAPVKPSETVYTYPESVAVPVTKTHQTNIPETKLIPYAFTAPASALAVAVDETDPFAYTFPASTGHVAKTAPSSSYAPKYDPSSSFTYAPKYDPSSSFTYAPEYAINSYLKDIQYGGTFDRSIHSPAGASFAGPVPYFNNIENHGYPVLKK